MIRSVLFRNALSVCSSVLLISLMTSCGQKAQIYYQAEQVRQTLNELQMQSKKMEAEIMATGNLGRYQVTYPGHIPELKNYLANLNSEITQLKAERDMLKGKAGSLKDEVSSYRARFRAL